MNLRPLRPERSALPNCATSRYAVVLSYKVCCKDVPLAVPEICSPRSRSANFDRCASPCSLYPPPAALARLTRTKRATKLRYISLCCCTQRNSSRACQNIIADSRSFVNHFVHKKTQNMKKIKNYSPETVRPGVFAQWSQCRIAFRQQCVV